MLSKEIIESLKTVSDQMLELYTATAIESREPLLEEFRKELDKLKNRLSKSAAGDLTIKFGKFKGQFIRDVPAWYLLWCYEQDWFKKNNKDISIYIKSHLKSLKKEAADGQEDSGASWADKNGY